MMKKLLLASLFAVAGATPGFAADAVLADPVIDAPVSAYNWSGFYIGAQAGYGSSDVTLREAPLPIQFGGLPQDLELDGGLYGVVGGYNYQFGSWVVGLEAGWLGNEMDFDGPLGLGAEGDVEIGNLISVGPRVGYAFDRLLVYGEGGFAAAEYDLSLDSGIFDTDSEWGTGYFVGGGLEYAATDNVILGAEYNYADLSDEDLVGAFGGGSGDVAVTDVRIHTITARLTYKF